MGQVLSPVPEPTPYLDGWPHSDRLDHCLRTTATKSQSMAWSGLCGTSAKRRMARLAISQPTSKDFIEVFDCATGTKADRIRGRPRTRHNLRPQPLRLCAYIVSLSSLAHIPDSDTNLAVDIYRRREPNAHIREASSTRSSPTKIDRPSSLTYPCPFFG